MRPFSFNAFSALLALLFLLPPAGGAAAGSSPGLLLPAEGALLNAQPTFQWENPPGVQFGYQLVLDEDPNFASPEIETTLWRTEYAPETPLVDGLYHWRVRCLATPLTWGDFSLSRAFTLDTTPPGVPTLNDPSGLDTPQPAFSWLRAYYTPSLYELQVLRLQGTLEETIVDVLVPVPELSHRLEAPLENGEYLVRVRAGDAAGNWSAWSETVTFTLNLFAVGPLLQVPPDGAVIHDSTPFFNWQDYVPGILGGQWNVDPRGPEYTLALADNPEFSGAEFFSGLYPSTFNYGFDSLYPLGTSLPDGTYYWFVTAHDLVGRQPEFQGVWSFTLDTSPPSPPVLHMPAEAAILADHTPLFDWQDSRGDPDAYRLQVFKQDGTGESIYLDVSTALSFYIPEAPLPDGAYRWQVRAERRDRGDLLFIYEPSEAEWRPGEDSPTVSADSPARTFTLNTTGCGLGQTWQALAYPAGVTVGEGAAVRLVSPHGALLAERPVSGITSLTPEQFHVAGALATGSSVPAFIFHSTADGGSLALTAETLEPLLGAQPGLISLLGMPGSSYLAYVSVVGGQSRITLGESPALPGLSPVFTWSPGADAYGSGLRLLGMRFEADRPQGIWFTFSGEAGENPAFPASHGLEYLDLASGQVVEALDDGFPLGGFSDDQTLAAYGLHSDSEPGVIRDGFYVKDLLTCAETWLAFNPLSNLGGGNVLFSRDNSLLAWEEASGLQYNDPVYRIRVARMDGTGLVDLPVAEMIGLAGGESPLAVHPVGWLDDHLLLLQVRLLSQEKPLLLAWAPDPDRPLDPLLGAHQSFLLAEGVFMGFAYPPAELPWAGGGTQAETQVLRLNDAGDVRGLFGGELLIRDSTLYQAAGVRGLRTYDLHPYPALPQPVGTVAGLESHPVSLDLEGDFLFTSSFVDNLAGYRQDSLGRFLQFGNLDFSGISPALADAYYRGVEAVQTEAYGLLVFDPRGSRGVWSLSAYPVWLYGDTEETWQLSYDPVASYATRNCDTALDVAAYAAADELYLYLLCYKSGVMVLRFRGMEAGPQRLAMWSIQAPSPYFGGVHYYEDLLLDTDTRRLYVSTAGEGVQVLDISAPASPALLAVIPTPRPVESAILSGSLLFTAEMNGISAVDVSTITRPALLAHLDLPYYVRYIAVEGKYLYLANYYKTRLVTVSSP